LKALEEKTRAENERLGQNRTPFTQALFMGVPVPPHVGAEEREDLLDEFKKVSTGTEKTRAVVNALNALRPTRIKETEHRLVGYDHFGNFLFDHRVHGRWDGRIAVDTMVRLFSSNTDCSYIMFYGYDVSLHTLRKIQAEIIIWTDPDICTIMSTHPFDSYP
jgi:hypothetical protein